MLAFLVKDLDSLICPSLLCTSMVGDCVLRLIYQDYIFLLNHFKSVIPSEKMLVAATPHQRISALERLCSLLDEEGFCAQKVCSPVRRKVLHRLSCSTHLDNCHEYCYHHNFYMLAIIMTMVFLASIDISITLVASTKAVDFV